MKNLFIFIFCLLCAFFTNCSLFKSSFDSAEVEEEYGEEEGDSEEETFEQDEEDESEVVFVDEEDMHEGEEQSIFGDDREEAFSEPVVDEENNFVDGLQEEIVGEEGSEIPTMSSNIAPPQPPQTKKTWIPLKKIKTQPYQKAGFLVNAVYIARSQDTIETISQKIFNLDNAQQLHDINPHLKNRHVKVGDKIYYNSPRRPDDSNQILYYFEDIGAVPKEHYIQAGENIRTVASNLLGHKDSWKEIWATNLDIVSKGVLEQSVSIKYWSGDEVASMEVPIVEEESVSPPLGDEFASNENEEVSQNTGALDNNEASLGSTEDFENAEGDEEESIPEVGTSDIVLEDGDSSGSSEGFMGLIKKDGVLVTAVIVALIGVIFVPAILKRRKKKEYDFNAANFEVD